jgi:MoxR-like ATPase
LQSDKYPDFPISMASFPIFYSNSLSRKSGFLPNGFFVQKIHPYFLKFKMEEKKMADTQKPMVQQAARLIQEVEKVVVGKHNEITLLVCAMLSGSHVLIEDVPGVGKTTLASALAKAAGLQFKRAQFTPDVMASDITGFSLYNRQTEKFEYREGLCMTNLLLGDEINRASPKTQSALLEAMEEARVTVDGTTYPLPDPFLVIATQNPQGFVGTYPLPEAQLDRFAMKLSMGYPSEAQETDILLNRRGVNPLDKVQAVTDRNTIIQMRDTVLSATVDEEIVKYMVALVAATRKNPSLSLGASPRATLALMHIAQAWAFLKGRDYVTPEDVKAVYSTVIAHRLTLTQEAKLSGQSAVGLLQEILLRTPVPFRGSRKESLENRGNEGI